MCLVDERKMWLNSYQSSSIVGLTFSQQLNLSLLFKTPVKIIRIINKLVKYLKKLKIVLSSELTEGGEIIWGGRHIPVSVSFCDYTSLFFSILFPAPVKLIQIILSCTFSPNHPTCFLSNTLSTSKSSDIETQPCLLPQASSCFSSWFLVRFLPTVTEIQRSAHTRSAQMYLLLIIISTSGLSPPKTSAPLSSSGDI